MSKGKKLLILVVACILFCMNFGTASAETSATIYMKTEKTSSGIIRAVCMAEALGQVTNGKLRILYDASKLKLERTELGDNFKNNFSYVVNDPVSGGKEEGEVVIAFASAEEKSLSGTILTLTFSTEEEVLLKDLTFTTKVEELKNNSQAVEAAIAATVVGEEPVKKTETLIPEEGQPLAGGSESEEAEQKKNITELAISEIEVQTFNGKKIRPGVEIKDGTRELKEGVDYALSYSSNRKVGKATVKITGLGSYTGTKKVSFYIAPKAPSYRRLSLAKKKTVSIKWRKVKNADGYQIQLASDKKFTKKVRTITIKKNTILTKSVKIRGKRKYTYVRICSYKVFDGKTYYGSYGKVKRVRMK